MRNISFALTTEQFLDGSKSVTRRLGWKDLKPGTILMGVRKSQGLKPGEKVDRLGPLRVLSVRREPLQNITDEDCAREGFPDYCKGDFIAMFCGHMGVEPRQDVTRIEFERIDDQEAATHA